ncbi:hypothetical protein GGR57DRAFT_114262 [Xylariaceae sp. FL1272]|nr:hypothetical protein GGR57DRAFT_114262 [Xylariaceae sp. FL1272]
MIVLVRRMLLVFSLVVLGEQPVEESVSAFLHEVESSHQEGAHGAIRRLWYFVLDLNLVVLFPQLSRAREELFQCPFFARYTPWTEAGWLICLAFGMEAF